jgi:WhiB family redox-sensing transcriptional regulator
VTATLPWEIAACRGEAAHLFVPPTHPESRAQRAARGDAAKRICAQCPLQRDCLDYALRVHEPLGIWGGTDELERREIFSRAR